MCAQAVNDSNLAVVEVDGKQVLSDIATRITRMLKKKAEAVSVSASSHCTVHVLYCVMYCVLFSVSYSVGVHYCRMYKYKHYSK